MELCVFWRKVKLMPESQQGILSLEHCRKARRSRSSRSGRQDSPTTLRMPVP